MEIIDNIIDKIETLGKTQLEIYKYRLMLKTSTLLASLIYILIISFFLLLMAITFNIATAHWVGGLLGNIVLGYLIVSAVNAFIALIIYVFRYAIKSTIQDNILNHIQD
jgi:hypothetical protein